LTLPTAAYAGNNCYPTFLGHPYKTDPTGAYIYEDSPCRRIADTSVTPDMSAGGTPVSSARRDFVDKALRREFYNTNFTASWFLVRGDLRLNSSGNQRETIPGCGKAIDSRNSTAGPLRRPLVDTSRIPSSTVPLLGDGGASGSQLPETVGDLPMNTLLTATMTRGPVLYANGSSTPPFPPPATFAPEPVAAAIWWPVWTQQTLQDYRNFGVPHRNACNVLFADGSVRSLADKNKDGLINNGFVAGGGFADSTLEAPSDEIYSLYSLSAKR